jgi:protein-disulfide isomerase
MRQPTRPRAATLFLVGGVAVAVAMAACSGSMAPSPLTPTVPTITTLPSIGEMLSEKTLGSGSNTIIEYVSFSQTDSATFHLQVFPQLKSQYADTSKAQIIFRNLFVTGEVGAAVELPRCAGNARFFDAVDTIFRNQGSWLGGTDPTTAVERLMLGLGMSQSVINACVGNAALDAGLIAVANNALGATYLLPDGTQRVGSASQSSILAVPAVVVNGTLFDGYDSTGASNANFAPTLANVQPFLK